MESTRKHLQCLSLQEIRTNYTGDNFTSTSENVHQCSKFAIRIINMQGIPAVLYTFNRVYQQCYRCITIWRRPSYI